jgi:hypothetical protein
VGWIFTACQGGPETFALTAERHRFGLVVFVVLAALFVVLALLRPMRRIASWVPLVGLLIFHPGQPACLASGGDCGMTASLYSIPYSVIALGLAGLVYWRGVVVARRKANPNVV